MDGKNTKAMIMPLCMLSKSVIVVMLMFITSVFLMITAFYMLHVHCSRVSWYGEVGHSPSLAEGLPHIGLGCHLTKTHLIVHY